MSKPRILMISVRADHGGGPRHLYQLIQNIHNDFEVYVACPFEEPYSSLFQKIVGKQNMKAVPHRQFRFDKLKELTSFVREKGIKLIHSHGKGAGLYGRLIGIRSGVSSIHTFHGVHVDNYGPLQKWMYLKLESWLCSKTAACISVSDSERNTIMKYNLALDSKLYLVPNGVPIARKKESYPLLPRVLCITRDNYQKNPETALEIAHQLPNIEFKFVGIPLSDIWKKSLVNLNNVSFLGLLSEDQIIDQMNWASILLSTSRWEGLPLAILEAMSHQIGVVATNVIGNQDLVGKFGWMFENENAEAGARAIVDCLSDSQNYENKIRIAYDNLVQKYDEKIMCKETTELYRQFLKSN